MFFFHVVQDGPRIEDLEGSDLPDLESAREYAVASAQELVANAVKRGKNWVGTFDVRNAADRTVLVVAFPPVLIVAEAQGALLDGTSHRRDVPT